MDFKENNKIKEEVLYEYLEFYIKKRLMEERLIKYKRVFNHKHIKLYFNSSKYIFKTQLFKNFINNSPFIYPSKCSKKNIINNLPNLSILAEVSSCL